MSKVCTNVAIYSHNALADSVEIISITSPTISHRIFTGSTNDGVVTAPCTDCIITTQAIKNIGIIITRDNIGCAVTRSIECCQKARGIVECKILNVSF